MGPPPGLINYPRQRSSQVHENGWFGILAIVTVSQATQLCTQVYGFFISSFIKKSQRIEDIR